MSIGDNLAKGMQSLIIGICLLAVLLMIGTGLGVYYFVKHPIHFHFSVD